MLFVLHFQPTFSSPVVGRIDREADRICRESAADCGWVAAEGLSIPTPVSDVITAYSRRITECSSATEAVPAAESVATDEGKDGDDGRTPCPTVGCKMHLNKGCIYGECRRCCCRRFDALVKSSSCDAGRPVVIPKSQYCSQHKPRVPPHVSVDRLSSFESGNA